MNGKVHHTELACAVSFLLAVDANLLTGILLVLFNEMCALHEHAARTAGRIVNKTMVWLDDFDDELNDGLRSEELAALLSFDTSKLAKEVLVDLTEEVAGWR